MKEEKTRLTIRINPKTQKEFALKCRQSDKTMTEVLTNMIESYIDPESVSSILIKSKEGIKESYEKLEEIIPY